MSIRTDQATSGDSGVPEFKEALRLLRDGHRNEALLHVQRAFRLVPQNPFYMSYTGLLMATVEKRFAEAESLCKEALRIQHNHAQLYLNLAEMYQTAHRKADAIDVLKKGFVSTGRDRRVRSALYKYQLRRPPLFGFLSRSNPLNRILGKWRHRLLGPVKEC